MSYKRKQYFIAASILILLITSVLSITAGISDADARIIWFLRMPRCMTSILAGASLALAGLQMQSILRNPLADPHIMGVSAGSSLGAAIATLCGITGGITSTLSIAGAAFIGAAATAITIMAASRKFAGAGTLLIFGVMLGFIINAVISILQFSSDSESLRIFHSWAAGSFSHTTWDQIMTLAIVLCIGFIIAYRGRKGLDIILFGDEFAQLAGADTSHIRFRALLSCCLLTGAVTAFCGPLGFVGIVAPHISRHMTGTSSHATNLLTSMLTGSIICVIADLISQVFQTPLPAGSTIAMIGIPIILYVMLKKPSL